jgi:hypothetical protein
MMCSARVSVTTCQVGVRGPPGSENPPEVDEGRRKGEDDDTVVGMEDCIKVPLGTAFHKSQKYGRTHVI